MFPASTIADHNMVHENDLAMTWLAKVGKATNLKIVIKTSLLGFNLPRGEKERILNEN